MRYFNDNVICKLMYLCWNNRSNYFQKSLNQIIVLQLMKYIHCFWYNAEHCLNVKNTFSIQYIFDSVCIDSQMMLYRLISFAQTCISQSSAKIFLSKLDFFPLFTFNEEETVYNQQMFRKEHIRPMWKFKLTFFSCLNNNCKSQLFQMHLIHN